MRLAEIEQKIRPHLSSIRFKPFFAASNPPWLCKPSPRSRRAVYDVRKGAGISVFSSDVAKEGSVPVQRSNTSSIRTLLFEGDHHHNHQIIAPRKTTFRRGRQNLQDDRRRLTGGRQPVSFFLQERRRREQFVVTVCMEGTRPMLIEFRRSFREQIRHRRANGAGNLITTHRAIVLEKTRGFQLQATTFSSTSRSGREIDEPAADLGVIAAIAPVFKICRPPDWRFRRVGLTGRSAPQCFTGRNTLLNKHRLKKVIFADVILGSFWDPSCWCKDGKRWTNYFR